MGECGVDVQGEGRSGILCCRGRVHRWCWVAGDSATLPGILVWVEWQRKVSGEQLCSGMHSGIEVEMHH